MIERSLLKPKWRSEYNRLARPEIYSHMNPITNRAVLASIAEAALLILFVISVRLFFLDLVGTAWAPYVWIIVMCTAFMILPIHLLVLILMAFVVFFQQSLWYMGSQTEILTIYEVEVFYAKPIEWLLATAFLRLLWHSRGKIRFNRRLLSIVFAWIIALVVGAMVAFVNEIPITDMMIMSESRNVIHFLLLFLFFGITLRSRLLWFTEWGVILCVTKVLISIPGYLLGYDLLWPTAALGYGGGHTAGFFGSDEDVITIVYGLCAAIGLLALDKSMNFVSEGIGPYKTIEGISGGVLSLRLGCSVGVAILAIGTFLSLRRGGILAAGIAVLVILMACRVRTSVLIGCISLMLSLFVVKGIVEDANWIPQTAKVFIDRITGADRATQISNWAHLEDIRDGVDTLTEHWLFGRGIGARIESGRTSYYVGGPAQSLLIHQAILHVWLKMGMLGVAAYILTYVQAVRLSIRIWKRRRIRMSLMGWSQFGFLASMFVWELFTPPFFQNFRRTLLMALAMSILAMVYKLLPNQEVQGLRQ
ncbi:MAG: O-antigen ligase family protein [Acidobacteria bacterium]|nr:O-antigen ligase family protein [Acidobacteriota bacterium]